MFILLIVCSITRYYKKLTQCQTNSKHSTKHLKKLLQQEVLLDSPYLILSKNNIMIQLITETKNMSSTKKNGEKLRIQDTFLISNQDQEDKKNPEKQEGDTTTSETLRTCCKLKNTTMMKLNMKLEWEENVNKE